MKETVKLVVLVPVGGLSSTNTLASITDTIESVLHYTTHDRRVVIQDNSNPLHVGDKLVEQFPELTVVRAPNNFGAGGGLYKSLSLSLLHIQASYDFQVLLKMNTDAILTGYGMEDDAIEYFKEHPNAGEIGTHVKDGTQVEAARARLLYETGNFGWLMDRKRCAKLRYYLQFARGNGYEEGEHMLAGASFYSPKLMNKFVHGDFLLREEISRSKLQDHHLSALLCRAAGMELGDFQLADLPLGNAPQKASRTPEDVVKLGGKVIHSTKTWENQSEQEIRDFFKARRAESLAVSESLKASIESLN
jgi:hypothetical protein